MGMIEETNVNLRSVDSFWQSKGWSFVPDHVDLVERSSKSMPLDGNGNLCADLEAGKQGDLPVSCQLGFGSAMSFDGSERDRRKENFETECGLFRFVWSIWKSNQIQFFGEETGHCSGQKRGHLDGSYFLC